MFCRVQVTDDPIASWSAINRARLSHELEPYRAPRPRYQVAAIIALLATVMLLAFF
jgi:hypothetical protein